MRNQLAKQRSNAGGSLSLEQAAQNPRMSCRLADLEWVEVIG
jgi:hypothetical protein